LTFVTVTHNLAVVAHLCEEVGVMQAGEMVEKLPVAALRSGEARHPHTRELRALTVDLEEP
ncbi:ABC transporter ATP-binding protein, partial [Mycobacterium tuberculosis]|nr:ABC transporter ATP-binding protein [Mycobacterium tuberculosis]